MDTETKFFLSHLHFFFQVLLEKVDYYFHNKKSSWQRFVPIYYKFYELLYNETVPYTSRSKLKRTTLNYFNITRGHLANCFWSFSENYLDNKRTKASWTKKFKLTHREK